ncbi:MAG: class I SAM-dependent methyltransferase [Nannocystaceae bacterium]
MSRFDDAYAAGTPPWDIGRAQPRFAALLAQGRIRGRVLDVGCGTGENALACARANLAVLGVDLAPLAIERARHKAAAQGLAAEFEVADALALASLRRSFDTVIDCAVFHVFDDPERARYVESLHAVLVPGGRYFMMVFSEREPSEWGGPRRVRGDEIEAAFAHGWVVRTLERDRFVTNMHPDGGEAWFAEIERSA